jgi:hypothetical protein
LTADEHGRNITILVCVSDRGIEVDVGKLYRVSDNQFIANVNYQLFRHPAANNWWGELTLANSGRLNEGERFIIEFKDKRKSQCLLKKKVNRAVSGFPSRYIYHVTGVGPIE